MLFSEVTSAISFETSNLGIKLVDARNNLIDMHLIQSLKNEFCFDLPLFSKYPATSINSYFYKMTHPIKICNNVMAIGLNEDEISP